MEGRAGGIHCFTPLSFFYFSILFDGINSSRLGDGRDGTDGASDVGGSDRIHCEWGKIKGSEREKG